MASYVSVDGQLIARIVLRDVPRANAKAVLAKLHELGVTELAMLTGDKRLPPISLPAKSALTRFTPNCSRRIR